MPKTTLLGIAEDGQPFMVHFERSEQLREVYGTWNTDTNECLLCPEAWDELMHHRGNAAKLRPLMDRLKKYRGIGVNIEKEVTDAQIVDALKWNPDLVKLLTPSKLLQ